MAHLHKLSPTVSDVAAAQKGETVVFVVTEDWYFISHRLPMARAVRDLGFSVVVATRIGAHRAAIAAEGFKPVHVPFKRGSLNLLGEFVVVLALWRLFRKVRPRVVHAVALKPIVDAGLAAAMFSGITVINTFAGMGSVFGGNSRRSVLQSFLRSMVSVLGSWNRAHAIVQNNDDRDCVNAHRFASDMRTHVVRGSGVDIGVFRMHPEPPGPIIAMMVSRLLWDKGVGEMVEAARILQMRGVDFRVRIVGEPDLANPRSVEPKDIQKWQNLENVEFWGRRSDIAELWSEAHIGVLPSYYGEGVPKSLLEAAACGRPIVTTQTTGCRDLVPDGRTGILVPPRDAQALADAIAALVNDETKRRDFGANARALVEREFSEERVIAATQDLYRSLLTGD